jgi:hypothetical protein
MNPRTPWYTLLALLLALALAFAPLQSAFADDDNEIEILATVVSIDEAGGSLVVETEDGETYTVFPADDFDFSTVQVGDLLEVEGTLNEDGSISAFKVIIAPSLTFRTRLAGCWLNATTPITKPCKAGSVTDLAGDKSCWPCKPVS